MEAYSACFDQMYEDIPSRLDFLAHSVELDAGRDTPAKLTALVFEAVRKVDSFFPLFQAEEAPTVLQRMLETANIDVFRICQVIQSQLLAAAVSDPQAETVKLLSVWCSLVVETAKTHVSTIVDNGACITEEAMKTLLADSIVGVLFVPLAAALPYVPDTTMSATMGMPMTAPLLHIIQGLNQLAAPVEHTNYQGTPILAVGDSFKGERRFTQTLMVNGNSFEMRSHTMEMDVKGRFESLEGFQADYFVTHFNGWELPVQGGLQLKVWFRVGVRVKGRKVGSVNVSGKCDVRVGCGIKGRTRVSSRAGLQSWNWGAAIHSTF